MPIFHPVIKSENIALNLKIEGVLGNLHSHEYASDIAVSHDDSPYVSVYP